MSLGEFHENHNDEIVANDNRKYAAIAMLVFGVITVFVSIWTGYLIFLVAAAAALVWGAILYDKSKKRTARLHALEDIEQEDALDEALHPEHHIDR